MTTIQFYEAYRSRSQTPNYVLPAWERLDARSKNEWDIARCAAEDLMSSPGQGQAWSSDQEKRQTFKIITDLEGTIKYMHSLSKANHETIQTLRQELSKAEHELRFKDLKLEEANKKIKEIGMRPTRPTSIAGSFRTVRCARKMLNPLDVFATRQSEYAVLSSDSENDLRNAREIIDSPDDDYRDLGLWPRRRPRISPTA